MPTPALIDVLAAYNLTAHRSEPLAFRAGFQRGGLRHAVYDPAGPRVFIGTDAEIWDWLRTRDTILDDELAALGEDALSPAECARLVLKLHVEGRSRAALRDLFPEVYAQHFED